LPRVLVIAPNWIGDALMAQPLLSRLQGATIDVLAPPWVAPVVRRMPEVSEVIAENLQLGERWRIARRLKGRYDAALVLPNSWKSALIPFFAGIPRRIGYRGEMRYGLLNDVRRASGAPMLQHYAGLADGGELTQPRLRVEPAEIEETKRRFGLGHRYAVFCPGAEYGPAKRWPYFKEAAIRLGLPVVLLGSAKDRAAAADVAGKDLVGKTTLDEAMCLIAGAELVLSNDSGLMHVAAALERPQVALFGSSSPLHTPPASPRARVLWLKLECSPCFERECPLGHFRCMKDITVDRVLAEIAALR
jgi:heptosyltransferase-2